MKKIIMFVLSLVIFTSCTKNETPQIIEGEIVSVKTCKNSTSQTGVAFIADIDAEEDGEKIPTEQIYITGTVASMYVASMSAGYQPFFIRLKLGSDGRYEFQELAMMNYDMGTPPQYQFQSNKKWIRN